MPFENCFYHRRDLGDASIDFERHRFIQHHYDHICISIMIIIIKYLSIDRYTLTRRREDAGMQPQKEIWIFKSNEIGGAKPTMLAHAHFTIYSFSVTECSLSFKQSFRFSFILRKEKNKSFMKNGVIFHI